jgi:hypothetical protein
MSLIIHILAFLRGGRSIENGGDGSVVEEQSSVAIRAGRGPWRWIVFALLLAVAVLAIVVEAVARRAGPILKGRVIETLSTRFHARVELDTLDVSLAGLFDGGLEVSGEGLRIANPDDVVAAGATRPLIAVKEFRFDANLRGLFLKPMHVGTVRVSGLEIRIPPRQMREAAASSTRREEHGRIRIVVDRFQCQEAELIIDNGNPAKEPKRFELRRIDLARIGPDEPLSYDATLVNAIPRGDIHAAGTFGPWNTESPGDSTITGHYTFDHADLGTIKGIGGTLASVGDFRGRLNRIDVTGSTDTPGFSLDSANQPMPLSTKFHAIVDGTTGDTYLDPVEARLRGTPIVCRGSVVNERGVGHTIDLDVDIPDGQLADLLGLAVKTRPVYLTAGILTRAKLHIRPGKESVAQKLDLRGRFTLRQLRFTNPGVQQRVDEMSMRAQGRPGEAKPDAPLVASEMVGNFVLERGRLTFDKLDYTLPGAEVLLTGVYSLDGEQFDFHGKVRTQAEVSQMVSKWWQRLLLKPVDRFFRKDGAGTEVPIRVSGTRNEPKFGLDFGHDRDARR